MWVFKVWKCLCTKKKIKIRAHCEGKIKTVGGPKGRKREGFRRNVSFCTRK